MKLRIELEIPSTLDEALKYRYPYVPYGPYYEPMPLENCTCGKPWCATIPPPPCPVHGQAPTLKVRC